MEDYRPTSIEEKLDMIIERLDFIIQADPWLRMKNMYKMHNIQEECIKLDGEYDERTETLNL